VLIKPVPVTVSVVAAAPALTLAGEIEVTVGAVFVVFWPDVLGEPPAHPLKKGTERQTRAASEKLWSRMKSF